MKAAEGEEQYSPEEAERAAILFPDLAKKDR